MSFYIDFIYFVHFIPIFGYPKADTAFLQKIIINNKSKLRLN